MIDLKKLREKMEQRKTDLLVVSSSPNLRYIFDTYGEFSCFFCIPFNSEPFIISSLMDKAGLGQAKFKIISFSRNLNSDIKAKTQIQALKFLLKNKKEYKKIGYDRPNTKNSFFKEFLEMRSIKTRKEIEIMKQGSKISDKGMKAVSESIREGITERELAGIYENEVRKKADWFSFQTIVASGKNSANPHYFQYSRKIKKIDFIVFDCGIIFKNYCTDLTRTFCLSPSEKQKKIYNIVLQAQKRAIEKIQPNIKAKEIDATARNYIKEQGYFNYFIHNTGHGVGIEIHESPSVSPFSKDILKSGMVFTVEPGIYIPNFGGVRIEDMIVLTKKGPELITKFPRKLTPRI